MNDSKHFGTRIARLRKRRKFSQSALAFRSGTSQATVSRVEASEQPPADTKLISQLALALDVNVTDLLAGMSVPSALLSSGQEDFYAFCANPFCDSNQTERNPDGTCVVAWNSSQLHHASVYDETNYCVRCGEDLVKSCPSCGKRLKKAGTKFCATCGAVVANRPTKDEWKKIEELHPKKKGKFDDMEDDIPF